MNKFCANCGKEIKAKDKFCPGCGRSVGLHKEEIKKAGVGFGQIFAEVVVAIIFSFFLVVFAVIAAELSASGLKNNPSYNAAYAVVFFVFYIVLTLIASFFVKKIQTLRYVWIFMLISILVVGCMVPSVANTNTKTENVKSTCQYPDLTDKNIKNMVTNYRVDNGKSIFINNNRLDEYARHMTDELIDQNDEERLKNVHDGFSDFYYENYSRSTDSPSRIKTTYSLFYDREKDPCKVFERLKSDKVINSQLLENKYSFIGVGVKYTFVYIVLAEQDNSPLPQQQNVYVQPSRPRSTTCRWNSLLNRMTCTEY